MINLQQPVLMQLENTFYSKIIDIWSIGIILYELLNKGQHPFYIKGVSKRNDQVISKKHNIINIKIG